MKQRSSRRPARPLSPSPLARPIFARELSRHTLHPALTVQAGRPASVTISTNMAGRGTDILLGGNAGYMAWLLLLPASAPPSASPSAVDNLYPCGLSKAQTELIDAAVSAFVAEQAASDAEVAPASLEAIDETLAVAASAAVVYEGSAVDALREAYEAVKAAFDEALEPEAPSGDRCGRAARHRHQPSRLSPRGRSATRPLRPSGRPWVDALLPLAGGSNFPPLWWRQG